MPYRLEISGNYWVATNTTTNEEFRVSAEDLEFRTREGNFFYFHQVGNQQRLIRNKGIPFGELLDGSLGTPAAFPSFDAAKTWLENNTGAGAGGGGSVPAGVATNASITTQTAALETKSDEVKSSTDLVKIAVDTNKAAVDLAKTAVDENKAEVILVKDEVAKLDAKLPAKGQNTQAESISITMASDGDFARYLELENWTSVAGNSVDIEYYTGVETGNPSGSIKNPKTVEYRKGGALTVTQTIAYNSDNLTINVTAS